MSKITNKDNLKTYLSNQGFCLNRDPVLSLDKFSFEVLRIRHFYIGGYCHL